MFSWVKKLFKGDLLAKSETQTYKGVSAQSASVAFHFEERPLFSIFTAELMEFDPKVSFGLALRNGLIKHARAAFLGGQPEVAKYAQKQWDYLWSAHGSRLIQSKMIGFGGFEVLYRESKTGDVDISGLKDFHCRDIRPLVSQGRVVGMTVGSVKGAKGKVVLWAPKCLWLTHKDRAGSLFGRSLLEKAYAPWWEKWQRGGAIKLRHQRLQKDCWIGDEVRYPSNRRVLLPGGEEVTYRDIMRSIAETRQSGGVFGLPSDRDEKGHLLFEYVPPRNIEGTSQIFDYIDHLDGEIMEGLEVPREVAEAAENGTGFSGRSIPFIAMLSVLQEEFDEILHQVDRLVLRPLCRLKFGEEPEYQARPAPLVKTVGKLLSGLDDDGKPTEGGGGPPNQPPSPAGGEKSYGYGSHNLSLSDAPRTHVIQGAQLSDRLSPRRIPRYGATVGGVYYPEGAWVDSSVLQFADSEELSWLDGVVSLDPAAETPVEAAPPRFSSTQFNLPASEVDAWLSMAGRIHPDDLAEDGVETEPHITIKYGLHTDDPEAVRRAVDGFGPVMVRFGAASLFEADVGDEQRGGRGFDVLKVDIESSTLVALNSLLGDSLDCTDTFPVYSPHATIAYLKPGLGMRYVEQMRDFEGRVFVFDRLTFSSPDREQTSILLTGRPMQLADKWITIGGKSEGGQKHKGGFPVQIDEHGVIKKGGPPGLRGKHVSQVGDHFAEERAARGGKSAFADISDFFEEAAKESAAAAAVAKKAASNPDMPKPKKGKKEKPVTEADAPGMTRSYEKIVRYQADRWGMAPETYEQISDELFRELSANIKQREEAREHARERSGLRATRISQLENSGKDYSSVKGLDTLGRELAANYPELGWGRGFEDQGGDSNVDYGEKVWELVKEGQQRISRVSPEFHEKVDEYLEQQMQSAADDWKPDPALEDVQFADRR